MHVKPQHLIGLLCGCLCASGAAAVDSRPDRALPAISYRLRVDPGDLTGFDVEMHLRNVPDSFRVAMPAHQEYDEKYWRYVESGRVDSSPGASVLRVDSAVWRVRAIGGALVVRYHVRLPAPPQSLRSAWRPYLTPTGGLVGGPYGVMYVVGAEQVAAHVTLDIPATWGIATGLEPTSDSHTFFAPNADVMADSPILVGDARDWRFSVNGVPHRVVYWPLPGSTSFDTTALLGGVQKLVREAVALFGRAPWREYTFIFEDGAGGALEHANSLTLGAPSANLARSQRRDSGSAKASRCSTPTCCSAALASRYSTRRESRIWRF